MKLLDINQSLLGQDHSDTVESIYELASIYDAQQLKWGEADCLYRKALQITRRVHSDEHPQTLKAMKYLA